MKIRDMAKCLEEFEQLCRAFHKSKNIVDKEGVPSFYIRLLADLEDYLNQVGSRALEHSCILFYLVFFFFLQHKGNIIFLTALGGQRGQEENEQKQRKSPEHAASEDPQVQQRL